MGAASQSFTGPLILCKAAPPQDVDRDVVTHDLNIWRVLGLVKRLFREGFPRSKSRSDRHFRSVFPNKNGGMRR